MVEESCRKHGNSLEVVDKQKTAGVVYFKEEKTGNLRNTFKIMLKLTPAAINHSENISPTTKCAEIHYFTPNFNIVCVLCQQLYQEYQHFLKHFQEQHLYEFMLNVRNMCHKTAALWKENAISDTPTSVKLELPELLQHKEVLTQSVIVEEAEELYADEESVGGELLYCKLEDSQERIEGNLPTHVNAPNITDIAASITNYISEDEDSTTEVDWSHTFSPNHLKLNDKRPYKPRNQTNSCTYCGKTFRRRYQLDTHLNIHTGLKPHQCDVCGRQFRAITTLQRHLNTHEKRQTHSCQFCSKEFTHRAALVSHETRHTQERRIPCEDCAKIFYTQNQLDTHRRKLHNKSDDDLSCLPFACDLCAKRYRSASMLSTHKFKKHYKTAKFDCVRCGKKFVEKGQLDEHIMSIHFKKC